MLADAAEQENVRDFTGFLDLLKELFQSMETDADLRLQLEALPPLPEKATLERVRKLQLVWAYILGKMSSEAPSEQGKVLCLMSKVSRTQWAQLRATREDKEHTTSVPELFKLLAEKAGDQVAEDHMNRHRKIMEQATRTKTVNMIKYEGFDEVNAIKGGGRGKGKGKGKGGRGRGGNEVPAKDPGFSATVVCKHCRKTGHYVDTCYRMLREHKKAEQALKKADAVGARPAAPSAPPVPPVPPVRPVDPLLPPQAGGMKEGGRGKGWNPSNNYTLLRRGSESGS